MVELTQSVLQWEVALVTGASRGIGLEVATELARAGADVAVTSRHLDALDDTCRKIEALGRRVIPVELEITDLASIRKGVKEVERKLGPITLLVNNAGINIPRPATEVTEEQWDQILDINLKGAFFCSKEVGQRMIERQRGKVINVASAAGLIPAYERAAYCSSKAGLVMLTRVLALEWHPTELPSTL